jgi:hypothetical protein
MVAVGALIAMSTERGHAATGMALSTFASGHVNDTRSRKLLPAVQITSATSKGCRVIPFDPAVWSEA